MSDSSEDGVDSNEAKRARVGSSDEDDDDDVNEVKSASDSDDDAVIAVEGPGSPVSSSMSNSISSSNLPTASNATTVVADSSGACADSAVIKTTRAAYGPDHSFRRDPNKYHLLIGVTGSVATIKLADLVSDLFRQAPPNRLVIRIVTTNAAKHFFDASQLELPVYDDADEWSMWRGRGDPVLHIELRKWADAMVIAPLDANTLAKIAQGLCDNLLTSIVRAWDPHKTLYFAPAMNTYMWENPLTYKHMETLKGLLSFREIPPVEKELICGDKGYGAMAPTTMIASIIASDIKNKFAFLSVS